MRFTRIILALSAVGIAFLLPREATHPTANEARGAHSTPPSGAAITAGYEVKDLSAKGLGFILVTLAASAATLIGIVFLIIWLFTSWDHQATAGLTQQQVTQLIAPGPHLQLYGFAELQRERARELHQLNSYTWLDASHTRAHVPIKRAMTMVVGQSLDAAP